MVIHPGFARYFLLNGVEKESDESAATPSTLRATCSYSEVYYDLLGGSHTVNATEWP